MREKMKIAVVGCGRFSPYFVPLFKADPIVEEVYVCDLKRDRAEKFAKDFDVKIIDTYEEVLASKEINAVAVFTQRFTHGQMVIRALKAGKHVYSSVPCAVSVDDIKEIERLVRETRLTYSMGETGFYRPAACYLRREFAKGTFGRFTYGEAQYNHDIRNMELSFRSSGGDDWKRYAGIPPFFYPSHSTSMVLSAMPGVYAKRVVSFGFRGSERTDIYGTDGQNDYNNPFANEAMLIELSNGGIVRICENRCVGWVAPETFVTQFYGDRAGYEFSIAKHSLSHWTEEDDHKTTIEDVTDQLQPKALAELIKNDYDTAIKKIAANENFFDMSPAQPVGRVPKEYESVHNGHNGTHHFLVDDFCRAYETGKLSPTNIWAAARFNIPGLVAHQSALAGGQPMEVPDLGNPPEDWEVLPWDKQ